MTTAAAFAGLDPCVHCGFCLQSCPTFLVTGDEADGPRGRIVLMQGLRTGRLDPTDRSLVTHLDRCLGCRACEPVCPAGVRYGPALEAARARLASVRPIPLDARLVHAVMARPWLRVPLLGAARLVRPLARWLAGPSRLGFAAGMLATTGPVRSRPANGAGSGERDDAMTALRDDHVRGAGERDAALPLSRAAVIFRGCIMSGLFHHVHDATARVLRLHGYAPMDVPGQGCCGALHAHAGQHAEAVALARRNAAAFAGLPADAVIAVNSAGCGAMLEAYGTLLADDPLAGAGAALARRVADVSELVAARGPRRGAPLPLTVAYDPPCHLLHAMGVQDAPLAMLDAVPELRRVEHAEADVCCGSAGSYSLAQPELSRAVLDRKVGALRAIRPDVVATGNPGCIMQIGAGLLAEGDRTPVTHPVELLDWSYRRAGYYDD